MLASELVEITPSKFKLKVRGRLNKDTADAEERSELTKHNVAIKVLNELFELAVILKARKPLPGKTPVRVLFN